LPRETCDAAASIIGVFVRNTRAMLGDTIRMWRVSHPAPELLVSIAVGDPQADRAVQRHISGCVVCRAEIDAMQESAATVRQQVHLEQRAQSPDCIDELAVADFIDGRLQGEARARVVRHLVECAHCRSVVRATAALVADQSVAREMPERARRGSAWRVAAVAATAAAVIVFMTMPGRDAGRAPTLREPAVTTTVAPVALTPRGTVTEIRQLVWSGVPGAERYRLRVHRTDGTVLWSAITQDTSLALPTSVRLMPETAYFWRVEAQTEWRRWVASDMTPFRIDAATP